MRCFEAFSNYYRTVPLSSIDGQDIRLYLQKLVREKRSDSYINLAINSINFYYEVVLNAAQRFYSIERPMKKEKLPGVLSQEEVRK